MNRTLIILDLNGVLATKKRKSSFYPLGWKIYQETLDFLSKLSQNYDFAIWTSTTEEKASPCIINCFSQLNPKFVWFRNHHYTLPDPQCQNYHDTIKNLSHVKKEFPEYNRIIIIDDDFNKIRFNQENEIIVTTEFGKLEKTMPSNFYHNIEKKIEVLTS